MSVSAVLDSAGRRRSPATMLGYHAGRPPRNKGMRYPADPPTVEEIIAVMRHAGEDRHGARLRALLAVLWRGGLRVQEALSLTSATSTSAGVAARAQRQGWAPPRDRDGPLGLGAVAALLVSRLELPIGRCSASSTARLAGDPGQAPGCALSFAASPPRPVCGRRFAPHELRDAHALELAREGVALNIIQRQLGHASLGTTSIYLQGIDTEEIIATVHARRAPMMFATAGLRL